MKFCYCPECKQLHPKNWYSGRTCDICNQDCTIIAIPTSLAGYLMYSFSILAVILIVINLLGSGGAFSGYLVPSIFGAILAAFVCAYVEIGRGTEKAYERIQKKA